MFRRLPGSSQRGAVELDLVAPRVEGHPRLLADVGPVNPSVSELSAEMLLKRRSERRAATIGLHIGDVLVRRRDTSRRPHPDVVAGDDRLNSVFCPSTHDG